MHKNTVDRVCKCRTKPSCRVNCIRNGCSGLIMLLWLNSAEAADRKPDLNVDIHFLPWVRTVAWKSHLENCSSIFLIISHPNSSQNDKYMFHCLKPNFFVDRFSKSPSRHRPNSLPVALGLRKQGHSSLYKLSKDMTTIILVACFYY